MIEAVCVGLIAAIALGARWWKQRAYRTGYGHGQMDENIRRQIRMALAPGCWCDQPSDPSIGCSKGQCSRSGRCTISGQLVTHYRYPPNG